MAALKPGRPKPTEPPDYAKAVYEARLLLTRKKVAQVEAQAAKVAQKSAELSKLRFVQALLDVVEGARQNQETLDQAREKLRTKLKASVSPHVKDSYLDLAIGNNLQVAYNSGRVESFLEPEMMAERPFWIFDAMMDMRTSRFCSTCNGTIRPAGDPWFMRRIPPCHHRCRSTVRALRSRYAGMLGGVTSPPPRLKPDAGFGQMWGGNWKPDLSGVAPALVKVYRSRR